MTKKRLYLLLTFALLAGYGWLIWSHIQQEKHAGFTPCVFKNVTGVACPSCGNTRSLLLITEGDFTGALLTNPMGYILAFIMFSFPLWLVYDVIFKKETLYKSYRRFENILKIKWIATLLVILVIMNWIWNIQKGM